MSAWLPAWPWYGWMLIAWVASMCLIGWLNHLFWKRFKKQMKPWEDEHRDGGGIG